MSQRVAVLIAAKCHRQMVPRVHLFTATHSPVEMYASTLALTTWVYMKKFSLGYSEGWCVAPGHLKWVENVTDSKPVSMAGAQTPQ